MNQWKERRLGDVLELLDARRVPLSSLERESIQGLYPYYGASGIIDHLNKYIFDGNYLLIAEDGENLNSRKLPIAFWARGKFWVNNHAHIAVGKDGQADTDFIRYCFASADISGFITGTAQPKLSQANLKKITFRFPSFLAQKKIAAILSAYDKLIENNQRRITLLEKMAEEIYLEWFVRLRFPGHDKVKIVKGVPEGWRVERVADLVDRKRFGRIYRESELLSEGAVVVIDQSTKDWLGFHEGKAEHQASPDRPLILFGDHSCKMQLMIEPFSLAENVIPFTSKDEMPIIFLYYLVHSLVETTEYKRHWADLITKQVFVPTNPLQKQFDEKARNLIVVARNLKAVNVNLSKTRDRLLPRLISGKISVENLDIQFPPSMAAEMKTEAAHA